MLKLKDIVLSAGGLLALTGAAWFGAVRSVEARRGVRLTPGGGALRNDLTAQFVEAAEKAVGEIDRRSDELRLLLEKTEERLAAVRRPWPEPSPANPFREIPAVPAALGGDAVRATPADLRSDQETALQGRFAIVYRLADQGFDLGDIAAKVKLTKGEVQLILGLRKAR
ncbi:MAG TPA: hypothetical protein VGL40_10555 [Bacillota bacterium]